MLQHYHETGRFKRLLAKEVYLAAFSLPDEASWGAVYRIFDRAYFHRVWLQQEIATSVGRESTLQCDKGSIPWICPGNIAHALTFGQGDIYTQIFNDSTVAALQGSQLRVQLQVLHSFASKSGFRESNSVFEGAYLEGDAAEVSRVSGDGQEGYDL